MAKKQVVVIHGGDTFNSYEDYLSFLKSFEIYDIEYCKRKGWKNFLQDELGEEFEVISPEMPNRDNAKYVEWKIWFEKIIPLLDSEVILIGHSMGGIFLAKFLSENDFPKKIRATILVAAPYDEKDTDEALGDFNLPDSLEKFTGQSPQIILYHSKDDLVVPFVDFLKYKRGLPSSRGIIFENRGHFGEKEFPELIKEIKALY